MVTQAHDIPKYIKISRDIIDKIKKGKLKPGMRILSENEIIDKYNISNTTARKALHDIESAGWVTRVKCRGTFVRKNQVERSATSIISFTKNMLEAGFNPSTKLLDARVIKDDYYSVINGRKYTLKGPLYKIHRLRMGNDIPMMLEIRYISLRFCPGIEKKDLRYSLYDIYEKDYNLKLIRIDQMLNSAILDKSIEHFFNVRKPTAAFLVEGITFTGKEMILEMERSVYRGDKYHFSFVAI
jgi:GntR family transcriptional regulator